MGRNMSMFLAEGGCPLDGTVVFYRHLLSFSSVSISVPGVIPFRRI